MKLELTIESENAAFIENHGFDEVARILREAANLVENGNVRQNLRDINGNTVGEFFLMVDEPEEEEEPEDDGQPDEMQEYHDAFGPDC